MSDAYAPKIDFKNKQTECHVHQRSNIQQTQLDALFADFIHDNDLQWAVQMFDRHPNIYVVDQLRQDMFWIKKMVGDVDSNVGDERQVTDQLCKIQSTRQNLERWVPILVTGSKTSATGYVAVNGEITTRCLRKGHGKPIFMIKMVNMATGAYYQFTEYAQIRNALKNAFKNPIGKTISILGNVVKRGTDGGYSITSPKIIGKMSERAP